MRPVLYSYFRSSCSYRVRIALYLKNIDFTYKAIPLLEQKQKTREYLSLNPKGEVPCLIDGDLAISQSMAIIQYLDKKTPHPPLFPGQAENLALCLQLCELVGTGIQPLQNIGVLAYLTKEYSLTPTQKNNWITHWIFNGFVALEKVLQKSAGTHCVRDNITAADLFLIPQIYNARRFNVKMDDFKNILRVEKNCLGHPAFIQASPANSPDSPE
ncbi:MAG: maleylacetoacetate isomerase [Halobacteriovoraceae bacterium]|nr:maleylacetoacetate isomerase [Halobacteriovoraceae bacterium]